VGKQRRNRLNVARIGRMDITERRRLAEVGNYLVISRSGAIFVIEGLIERTDFYFDQWSHVHPPW
jgi:hypothetical protein